MRFVLYRNRRKWRMQMQAFAALVAASLRCVVNVDGNKVIHVSQGDGMESDLPFFEVLQKPRYVEAVLFESFLREVADASRM